MYQEKPSEEGCSFLGVWHQGRFSSRNASNLECQTDWQEEPRTQGFERMVDRVPRRICKTNRVDTSQGALFEDVKSQFFAGYCRVKEEENS